MINVITCFYELCFKNIIFFTDSKGLRARDTVKDIRKKVTLHLEDYMSDQQYEIRGRFGALLLILPVLQSISAQMITTILLAPSTNYIQNDSFLERMLLQSKFLIVLPSKNEKCITMISICEILIFFSIHFSRMMI